MEDALIEGPTMRRFAGTEKIPYEATILSFLHLLEKNNLGKEIFETVDVTPFALKADSAQGNDY